MAADVKEIILDAEESSNLKTFSDLNKTIDGNDDSDIFFNFVVYV
jgi:hypothetical protein